jgi:hypothetical protein
MRRSLAVGAAIGASADTRPCSECYMPRDFGKVAVGALAIVAGGFALLGGAITTVFDAQAGRCDVVLARVCEPRPEASCAAVLEAACAGGDLQACWALDPSVDGRDLQADAPTRAALR